MFLSVETDIHEKIDVAQLVGVFASAAHRQMEYRQMGLYISRSVHFLFFRCRAYLRGSIVPRPPSF